MQGGERIGGEMRVGSLFSGGGLGDFGFLMAGCEIVFQVEIDEYCQKLLALRYPDAKRFKDIRSVKGADLPECDIITKGKYYQPHGYCRKCADPDLYCDEHTDNKFNCPKCKGERIIARGDK
jgi:hypothetical protein